MEPDQPLQAGARKAKVADCSAALVLPAILDAYSNKDLPMQIDGVTTLVKIEFGSKMYVYHYTLSDDLPDDIDINTVKAED